MLSSAADKLNPFTKKKALSTTDDLKKDTETSAKPSSDSAKPNRRIYGIPIPNMRKAKIYDSLDQNQSARSESSRSSHRIVSAQAQSIDNVRRMAAEEFGLSVDKKTKKKKQTEEFTWTRSAVPSSSKTKAIKESDKESRKVVSRRTKPFTSYQPPAPEEISWVRGGAPTSPAKSPIVERGRVTRSPGQQTRRRAGSVSRPTNGTITSRRRRASLGHKLEPDKYPTGTQTPRRRNVRRMSTSGGKKTPTSNRRKPTVDLNDSPHTRTPRMSLKDALGSQEARTLSRGSRHSDDTNSFTQIITWTRQ